MKAFMRFAFAAAAVLAVEVPVQGRVQPQMFCWSPDIEFPVACEEEEEEDYGPTFELVEKEEQWIWTSAT